jgi:hypothetical protein
VQAVAEQSLAATDDMHPASFDVSSQLVGLIAQVLEALAFHRVLMGTVIAEDEVTWPPALSFGSLGLFLDERLALVTAMHTKGELPLDDRDGLLLAR